MSDEPASEAISYQGTFTKSNLGGLAHTDFVKKGVVPNLKLHGYDPVLLSKEKHFWLYLTGYVKNNCPGFT